MEDENKKSLAFTILILVVIVVSVGVFLWGAFINRGTIRFIGPTPFSVEIFGLEKFTCEASPCETSQKIGLQDLVLRKEGYRTLVTEVKVRLWRTVDFNVELEVIPHLENSTAFPTVESESKYELIFDINKNRQKLVLSNDINEIPIVFFPLALKNAQLFASDKYVFISTVKASYKVNVRSKTSQKLLARNLDILDGKWSLDGKYFIYSSSGSPNLSVIDTEKNSILPLTINSTIDQVEWIYNNKLIFISDQNYREEANYQIKLLNSKSVSEFTFAGYDPESGIYKKIESFSELAFVPEKIIATTNGQTIYFQSGEEKYKLVLKKF